MSNWNFFLYVTINGTPYGYLIQNYIWVFIHIMIINLQIWSNFVRISLTKYIKIPKKVSEIPENVTHKKKLPIYFTQRHF